MSDTIEYGQLMHQAMRGLMARVLEDAGKNGLPGEHHFFISFDTHHPDVELADRLRAQYPDDMTIVIQHWFDNLTVTDDHFTVTLNFGDTPEPMIIPFEAVKTFVDPSVEFGLRFEALDGEDLEDIPESPMMVIEEDEPEAAPKGDAEVVSLDSFRKN